MLHDHVVLHPGVRTSHVMSLCASLFKDNGLNQALSAILMAELSHLETISASLSLVRRYIPRTQAQEPKDGGAPLQIVWTGYLELCQTIGGHNHAQLSGLESLLVQKQASLLSLLGSCKFPSLYSGVKVIAELAAECGCKEVVLLIKRWGLQHSISNEDFAYFTALEEPF